MRKINKIALAYLLGTSLFYGLLIVVQKIGLNFGLDPLSFSFSRSIIIIFISLIFFSSQLKNLKFIKKCELRDLIILGIASAAATLILFIGQNITTAINAGFLTRLTPLFVLPFAYLLLKEKFSGSSIFFMFIMLIGAFLLTTNGVLISPHFGDLLIIIVALTVAFQNVFAKKIMHSVSADIVIFFRVCLSASLIVMFIPFLLGYQSISALFDGLFYVLLTAILYFLSVICHYRAIKLVGPFITTTFFLSGSLFSALFAYILLGEILSSVQWIGAAGILFAGYFLIKKM
ncbi:MAG: DMT family transporter [Candidatus Auribacterota bacterium]|nr:DMT family transporter [Candidatus Auribacterota bacterium]